MKARRICFVRMNYFPEEAHVRKNAEALMAAGMPEAEAKQTKAMKGASAARAAGIDGVPALLVDGKYLTSVSMTITEDRLFEVLDELIARARKERGGNIVKLKPAAKAADVAKQPAKPVAATK